MRWSFLVHADTVFWCEPRKLHLWRNATATLLTRDVDVSWCARSRDHQMFTLNWYGHRSTIMDAQTLAILSTRYVYVAPAIGLVIGDELVLIKTEEHTWVKLTRGV